MTDRQLLAQQLIDHEDLRLYVYDDATGKPVSRGDTIIGNLTIGAGHNLAAKGIPSSVAMTLLDQDIDEAITDLLWFNWFGSLDSVRQRAVVDFRFNVGAGTFREFKEFIAAMARKDYVRASQELKNSRWAKQVQPDRVKCLSDMIETGKD